MVKSHLMHTVKTKFSEMDNALLSARKRLHSCAVIEKKIKKCQAIKSVFTHIFL